MEKTCSKTCGPSLRFNLSYCCDGYPQALSNRREPDPHARLCPFQEIADGALGRSRIARRAASCDARGHETLLAARSRQATWRTTRRPADASAGRTREGMDDTTARVDLQLALKLRFDNIQAVGAHGYVAFS